MCLSVDVIFTRLGFLFAITRVNQISVVGHLINQCMKNKCCIYSHLKFELALPKGPHPLVGFSWKRKRCVLLLKGVESGCVVKSTLISLKWWSNSYEFKNLLKMLLVNLSLICFLETFPFWESKANFTRILQNISFGASDFMDWG